jgi:cytoskeletal protein RodZ
MTTRDHARPATDARDPRSSGIRPGAPAPTGPPGRRGGRPGGDDAGSSVRTSTAISLPERLHAARERKGVDLYRAERDTKIRARYLTALERGDYRELPGAVYVKGFLRNYALYLGLDPDEIIDQWRAERGEIAAPPATIAVPRPLTTPRRGLTFSPGIVVAALLTLAIVAFIGYLGVQLLRFAKPPTIAVSQPAAAVTDVEDGVSSFVFAGLSIPGATIEIAASGREQPYRSTANDDGAWTTEVALSRGRNQFVVTAKDPDTGRGADDPVERVIMVPFPVIEAPTLTVDSPTDGAVFENGAIPVTGRATNADSVTVTARWVGPTAPPGGASPPPTVQPSADPSPAPAASPSVAPSPTVGTGPPPIAPRTVTPADDGSFSVPLELTTGAWSITVTASSPDDKTVSLTRSVTVTYTGVNLVVTIDGGRAWLKVWVDGKLDETIGAAGRVLRDGQTVTFTATESVEVRTGNSGVTTFTLNGQALGALGRRGIPETWLFAPPAPPTQTSRT